MTKRLIDRIMESEKGVLDYLIQMKDASELIVDLAYSALLLNDKELAEDVVKLEKELDTLKYELQLKSVMSRVSPEEAEGMITVFQVAESTEQISNRAASIADLVLREIPKHPIIKEALTHGDANVFKEVVRKDAPVVGKRLEELNIIEATGLQLTAIKKRGRWRKAPVTDMQLEEGDVLLLSGPSDNKKLLDKLIRK